MQLPLDDALSFQTPNPRRLVSVLLVAVFHVFVIYAFMSGLAEQLVQKLPEEVKMAILPPAAESNKPPPPLPPQFVEPPRLFVPTPVIVIANTPDSLLAQSRNATPGAHASNPAVVPTAAIGTTHNCASYYPDLSQRLDEEGSVLIRYTVAADGTIGDVGLAKSSGFDRLDQAALACVRERWRNAPALDKAGAPTGSTSEAYVSFKLD